MLVFKITKQNKSILITFEDAPFEFIFAETLKKQTLNLEAIAKSIAKDFFDPADRGSFLPKRAHIALYDSVGNGINLAFACIHTVDKRAVTGYHQLNHVEEGAQDLHVVQLPSLDGSFSEDNTLVKHAYDAFAQATRRAQARFVLDAQSNYLNTLYVSVIPYPLFDGAHFQSEAYKAGYEDFKAEPGANQGPLSLDNFRHYEAKVAVLKEKFKKLNEARKDFDTIKLQAETLDISGLLVDLAEVEIKAKLDAEKAAYSGDTFSAFAERVRVEIDLADAEISRLQSPEKDLESVFFDAETLREAKKYAKHILYVGLYNFAVRCYNEILDANANVREGKINLFNQIFARINLSISDSKHELTPFVEAKRAFLSATNNDFNQIAQSIQSLLTAIKDQENKKPGMLGAASSWAIQKTWGGSGEQAVEISALTSDNISTELSGAQEKIDSEMELFFLEKMQSPLLYSRFYDEQVFDAALPKRFSSFSFARKYNPGLTKLRYSAIDAQFEWHLKDNDLAKRHESLQGILLQYDEEDNELETFNELDRTLSAYIFDANNTYLAYWQKRVAIYSELKGLKLEAKKMIEEFNHYKKTYGEKLPLDPLTFEALHADIKSVNSLDRDNSQAEVALDGLRAKLLEMRKIQSKVNEQVDLIKARLMRIAEYKTDEERLAGKLGQWIHELTKQKRALDDFDKNIQKYTEENSSIADLIKASLLFINRLLDDMKRVESGVLVNFREKLDSSNDEVALRTDRDRLDRLADDFESNVGRVPNMGEISKAVLLSENPYQAALVRLNAFLAQPENESLYAEFKELRGMLAKHTAISSGHDGELIAKNAFVNILGYLRAQHPAKTNALSFYQVFFPPARPEMGSIKAVESKDASDEYLFALLRKIENIDYKSLIVDLKNKIEDAFYKKGSGLFGGFSNPPTNVEKIYRAITEKSAEYNKALFLSLVKIASDASHLGNSSGSRTPETQAFYTALGGGVLPIVDWLEKSKKLAPTAAPSSSPKI